MLCAFRLKNINADDCTQDYYTKVDTTVLCKAEVKLIYVLEEGLDHRIITKSEYDAMDPEGKTAAKFSCTFKVNKTQEPMSVCVWLHDEKRKPICKEPHEITFKATCLMYRRHPGLPETTGQS